MHLVDGFPTRGRNRRRRHRVSCDEKMDATCASCDVDDLYKGRASWKELEGPARTMLHAKPVKELVDAKEKRVLVLEHNESVGEALARLAERKVLSAPVVVVSDEDDDGDGERLPYALLGVIDVGTVLQALVQAVAKQNARAIFVDETDDTDKQNQQVVALQRAAEDFFTRKVITLPMTRDKEVLYRGNLETDILTLVEEGFLLPRRGEVNHRILIFDERGIVTNIISQTDVLRYIYKHMESLGRLRYQTVHQLELSTKPVLVAQANLPALEAFRKMNEENVSGVAIVDSVDGKLVANLSISDLRGLTPAIFGSLALPLSEFLKREEQEQEFQERMRMVKLEQMQHKEYRAVPPPQDYHGETTATRTSATVARRAPHHALVSCRSYTTVEEVIRLMLTKKVHRVYEVDDHFRPIGVVTLTDVLWALTSPP